jgi:hypothetical protein
MSQDDQGDQTTIRVTDADLHPHLQARMLQRGVTLVELERTLNEGWEAVDAKRGSRGKVLVLRFDAEWAGRFYQQKEVTVYYREVGQRVIVLTVKARYGQSFRQEG